LAFVEVSSDGVNFFRFPSVCLLQDTVQYDNAANMDCRKIHNLAGKYLVNYGTPFDLAELSGIPGLDVNNITHIKIIDVVGCIQPQYARYDSQGHVINDPYPTPFASGGFDLDAVGVIHQNITGIQEIEQLVKINLYPNPFTEKIYIQKDINQVIHLDIFNVSGEKVFDKDLEKDVEILDLSILSQGQYFAIFQTDHRRKVFQLIK
jgi:hypothetical protein